MTVASDDQGKERHEAEAVPNRIKERFYWTEWQDTCLWVVGVSKGGRERLMSMGAEFGRKSSVRWKNLCSRHSFIFILCT